MGAHQSSEFAKRLGELFKHSIYTQKQWAKVLGVGPSSISAWLEDREVPSASLLRSIKDLGKDYSDPAAYERFKEILDKPSNSVSPLSGKIAAPTILHYMMQPLQESFLRILRTLTPADQELVLYDAADHCRRKLEGYTKKGSTS